MNRFGRTLGLVVSLGLVATPATAGSVFLDEEQRYTLNWGLDAYYTFFGLNGSLISPQPGVNVLDASEEGNVYGYLLSSFFIPRTMNLEVSANPLPILGVYLKDRQREFYDRGRIIQDINVLESVTTGFPEPGAVSLFVGNNVFLVNPETGDTEGIGFGGLLLSYGNLHIVSNEMVPDHWLETEAKLKGITLSAAEKLSFSFRVGARFHNNRNIRNTVYLAMARSHLDRGYFGGSPTRNSDAEFRVDFSQDDGRPTRAIMLVGKKLPSPSGEWVFSLAAGVEGVFASGYAGALARNKLEEGWTLLVRPNVTF